MAEYASPFPPDHRRPPVRLVGLMGHARAGKDSVAARLVEAHGFRRFAFADALRDAALALDPLVVMPDSVHPWRLAEVVASHGWEAAKAIPEVRRTLQNYGVAIRDVDPDFWVNVVARQLHKHDGPAVITDVRFPNEYREIRARGGLLVRVDRPGAKGNGHISETALVDYQAHVTVYNEGTLADLAAKTDAFVERSHRAPRAV